MRTAVIIASLAMLAACNEGASDSADAIAPDTQVNETAAAGTTASADFVPGLYAVNDDLGMIEFDEDMSFTAMDVSANETEGTWDQSPEGQVCLKATGAEIARCFSSAQNGNWNYTDPPTGIVTTLELVPEGGTGE